MPKKIIKKDTEEIDDLQGFDSQKNLPHDVDAILLGRIAYQIFNMGLTIRESCIIIGFNSDRFEKVMADFPFVKEIIDRKIIEYKKALLQPLVIKAKEGNDKLAQWLLEKRFPDEFGSGNNKPNKDELADANIFALAIKEIQRGDDNLISEKSGKAFIIQKTKSKDIKQVIKSVHELLK